MIGRSVYRFPGRSGIPNLITNIATRGETAVRYRTAVVVPSSLFELILVSAVPSPGCAAGAGRS